MGRNQNVLLLECLQCDEIMAVTVSGEFVGNMYLTSCFEHFFLRRDGGALGKIYLALHSFLSGYTHLKI